MKNHLLIKNGLIITCLEYGWDAIKVFNGDILVEKEIIKEISPKIDDKKYINVIDATDKLIIPGLINSYTRPISTIVNRSIIDDSNRNMLLWGGNAGNIEFPLLSIALSELSYEELSSIMRLSIIEMISFGTTSVIPTGPLKELKMFTEIANEMGIRTGVVPVINKLNKNLLTTYKETIGYLHKYDNSLEKAISSLIGIDISYDSFEYQNDKGNLSEMKIFIESSKMNLVGLIRQLNSKNFLKNRNYVLINPIIIDKAIGKALEELKVSIVYTSRDLMREGIFTSYGSLKQFRTNLGIGTGSYSFDILTELSIAGLMGNSKDANYQFKAVDVFHSATVGGAKILGYENLGRIAVNHKADLLIIDCGKNRMLPIAYPLNNLIYHGNNYPIDKVIINGNIIKGKGRYMDFDEEEITYNANQAIHKVWSYARQKGML